MHIHKKLQMVKRYSKTPLLRQPLSLRKMVFIVGWSYY